MTGIVTAVSLSPKEGVPKYPQAQITLGRFGIEGDYHNREMRTSFSQRGAWKPNTDRHVTIIAEEVLQELNRKLGTGLKPGDLGENITSRVLDDLSQVADGSIIQIAGAILRVSKQNTPCGVLRRAYGLSVRQALEERRGLLCAIERGAGAIIRPGDLMKVSGP